MKKILILAITLLGVKNIQAQERVITTGVPFLLVAADARAAGMADQGVATSPDNYSQQWNPAKFAFATDSQGLSFNYTPYLTQLVNDIALGQVSYYNKINERSAFAASLRYFGLGEIQLTDASGQNLNIVKPNEMAFDGSYSLKLSEGFSMAVAGRYIRSNLKIASENTDATPGKSFCVDIAGYFQSEEKAFSDFDGRYRLGFNFQNMGPKISYDNNPDISSNYLPANMRLGGGFDFIFDEYSKVSTSVEIAKLLVPTPQVGNSGSGYTGKDMNGDGVVDAVDYTLANEEYRSQNWFSGMIKSFNDAPGGMSEELRELTYSAGAEYQYKDSFAFRLGYFNENPQKGARKFFSLGAGFKYNVVRIDVSYLFSASKVRNPLENTLRFSLAFNFGDKYDNN